MNAPLSTVLGRRYDTQELVRIEMSGGTVGRIEPLVEHSETAAADLPWIGPGFVDLQINGFGGVELTSATLRAEDVRSVVLSQDRFGVVRSLPTVTTQSEDVLNHALATIHAAVEQDLDVARRVAGIHLEGPFISPEEGPRGAHPREHVRPPDWPCFCRWQEAAGGLIRLVTLAPEYDEAPAFIARAVASGVRVAIGHTGADSAAIGRAVDAGASLSTHLGNGAHARLPRHPNYIWDQLSNDRLTATLIADGVHLPPSVLKSMVRAKQPHRCLLVSDLAGTAGQPPGTYETPLGRVEILDDGRIVVAGQREYLAGAGKPIVDGVRNLVRFAGVPLSEAIDMASIRPANFLDLPPHGLQLGAPADLILFTRADDGTMTLSGTIHKGCLVWGRYGQLQARPA